MSPTNDPLQVSKDAAEEKVRLSQVSIDKENDAIVKEFIEES